MTKPYTAHSYRDAAGDWRWNIKAPNGRIVADLVECAKVIALAPRG